MAELPGVQIGDQVFRIERQWSRRRKVFPFRTHYTLWRSRCRDCSAMFDQVMSGGEVPATFRCSKCASHARAVRYERGTVKLLPPGHEGYQPPFRAAGLIGQPTIREKLKGKPKRGPEERTVRLRSAIEAVFRERAAGMTVSEITREVQKSVSPSRAAEISRQDVRYAVRVMRKDGLLNGRSRRGREIVHRPTMKMFGAVGPDDCPDSRESGQKRLEAVR